MNCSIVVELPARLVQLTSREKASFDAMQSRQEFVALNDFVWQKLTDMGFGKHLNVSSANAEPGPKRTPNIEKIESSTKLRSYDARIFLISKKRKLNEQVEVRKKSSEGVKRNQKSWQGYRNDYSVGSSSFTERACSPLSSSDDERKHPVAFCSTQQVGASSIFETKETASAKVKFDKEVSAFGTSSSGSDGEGSSERKDTSSGESDGEASSRGRKDGSFTTNGNGHQTMLSIPGGPLMPTSNKIYGETDQKTAIIAHNSNQQVASPVLETKKTASAKGKVDSEVSALGTSSSGSDGECSGSTERKDTSSGGSDGEASSSGRKDGTLTTNAKYQAMLSIPGGPATPTDSTSFREADQKTATIVTGSSVAGSGQDSTDQNTVMLDSPTDQSSVASQDTVRGTLHSILGLSQLLMSTTCVDLLVTKKTAEDINGCAIELQKKLFPKLQPKTRKKKERYSVAELSDTAFQPSRKRTDFPRKILVADDSSVNRKLLVRMLHQIGVSDVDAVENGQEALNHALKKAYDIILLDIDMPVMSGTECLRQLKRHKVGCPVAFVTCHVEEKTKHIADGFLTKPFSVDQVNDLVLKLWEKR